MARLSSPLTDEDRARMAAEASDQRAARTAHLRTVEASRIGVMVLLEVGVTVWSKTCRDHNDEAIGGVVVMTSEGEREPDTGFTPRRFHVLNPFAPPHRWEHVLDEGDVDRETVEVANAGRLVTLITRLQAEGGKRKGRVLTPRDGRWIEYERALKAVVLP